MENLNQENLLFENLLNRVSLVPKSKILVINCGTGESVKWLEDQDFIAMGIDQDFSKIREASRLYPKQDFYQHDLENIFYVNFFDGVFMLEPSKIFHGTASQNGYILKNALACLEKNGVLILIFSDRENKMDFQDWISSALREEKEFSIRTVRSQENSYDSITLEIIKNV